ncbi:MAG: hypothetical protein EOO09_13825 [Chitinophagaceae bacterium]|nr:MAG: hypothetical protein EOO09_13825 [Chitinophagaceae bacterium]
MKISIRGLAAACSFLTIMLGSCSDKEEEFITEPLSDYMLMVPGKYITYRLDSTVTTAFGVNLEIHSYQVKHVVDAEITDNEGNRAFRVFRYLRNEAGTSEWVPNGTYMVTDKDKQIEVQEDNLRFLKLQGPVREGISWKGNYQLPDRPYAALGYNIAVVDYMKDWEYYYAAFDETLEVNGQLYNDVYTVEQENFIDNWPVMAGTAGVNIRAYEQYAKGIGLVHRSTSILEYDPGSGGAAAFNGFAVDMWMIDHN